MVVMIRKAIYVNSTVDCLSINFIEHKLLIYIQSPTPLPTFMEK